MVVCTACVCLRVVACGCLCVPKATLATHALMQSHAIPRPALGVLSQRVRACVRLRVRVHAGGRVRRGRGRERARAFSCSWRFSMLEQNLEKRLVSNDK